MFNAMPDNNYAFQLVKIVCFRGDGGTLYKKGQALCNIQPKNVTECNTVYGSMDPGHYRFEVKGPATLYNFYDGQLSQRIEVHSEIEFNITKHTFGIV